MLNEQKCEHKIFDEYASTLDYLTEDFKDFDEHTPAMNLEFEPHLEDISTVLTEQQMELLDLGEDSILKALFDAKKDSIEILKKCTVEYPCL
ncbi:general transcription factor II-I repeat domain-containing protein 2B [Trichonephila inaurata madagascariensis]|uniref:General transcription factor II-I repeat domain-containing protein 2B n=1 Tax=Trichonephila inaurata madagascariensis TaxID=2747483 RepID=A0A8X6YP87_9ARAC|nr:general transcription factor II-I repeat domain-containing protein 2B [Trichonephila inaurata madagascariensis]